MTTCPRCQGRVFHEHDRFGDTLSCVCGWSRDCAPDGGLLPVLDWLRHERTEPRDPVAAHERRSASQSAAWARRWAEGRR